MTTITQLLLKKILLKVSKLFKFCALLQTRAYDPFHMVSISYCRYPESSSFDNINLRHYRISLNCNYHQWRALGLYFPPAFPSQPSPGLSSLAYVYSPPPMILTTLHPTDNFFMIPILFSLRIVYFQENVVGFELI